MKKLFFAAVAAMAIVSVSSAFAFDHTSASFAGASDTDTVASIALADTTDTTATPASLFGQPDTVAPSTPDSVPAQK